MLRNARVRRHSGAEPPPVGFHDAPALEPVDVE